MTGMNACLRTLILCVLLTTATVVAGTRIVAAQPKEPPAPSSEETQRVVELPPTADNKDLAEETERPTCQAPRGPGDLPVSPSYELDRIIAHYENGRPETPGRRKALENHRKELLALKKEGHTRWGSEKWMKTPEYYAKLNTATLADEFFARPLFMFELSGYDDPRFGFINLLVSHDGFAEWYSRDDFSKGVLHAYDSLSLKLVDPESSLVDIVTVSGHLEEMRFFYGEPKFRRQVKGREKPFLDAHIRVLRRYVRYMDHHDLKKKASFGFFCEPCCVARVALMLTKQVDPERYARIAPKITAVRFSRRQNPEQLREFVRLVLNSLEAEPKPEGT